MTQTAEASECLLNSHQSFTDLGPTHCWNCRVLMMSPDWMDGFFWVSGAWRCGSDSSSLLLLLLLLHLKKRFISLLPGMFSIMLHFYQVFQPRHAAQSGPADLQHVGAGAYIYVLVLMVPTKQHVAVRGRTGSRFPAALSGYQLCKLVETQKETLRTAG